LVKGGETGIDYTLVKGGGKKGCRKVTMRSVLEEARLSELAFVDDVALVTNNRKEAFILLS
jgi:hypothetical protein